MRLHERKLDSKTSAQRRPWGWRPNVKNNKQLELSNGWQGSRHWKGANAPAQVLKHDRSWPGPSSTGEKVEEGGAKGLVEKTHFTTLNRIPAYQRTFYIFPLLFSV